MRKSHPRVAAAKHCGNTVKKLSWRMCELSAVCLHFIRLIVLLKDIALLVFLMNQALQCLH